MNIIEIQTRFNPTLIKGVGIASVLFFGATGIYGIKKLFDNNVGLTIDDSGIIDNTNATSIGLIKWADIIEKRTEQVMSTKFLLIFTKDPNEILEKVSRMKRKLMAGNMKMYGTPLSITSTTLKYNFNALKKLLKDRLN
ncbi:STM3941 family protein [Halpernia sp. GG3]